jgi:hypothetical protein
MVDSAGKQDLVVAVGPRTDDERALFGEPALESLRRAAADLRCLLDRGYNQKSALRLVADHFQLRTTQRQALMRAVTASEKARSIRRVTVGRDAVAQRTLVIDGHNVLLTLESALTARVLVRGDDGFLRDTAERHGSYRQSSKTETALALMARAVARLRPAALACFLDRPVPWSAQLAEAYRLAVGRGARVELANSADAAVLAAAAQARDAVVATSDSAVLLRVAAAIDLVPEALAFAESKPWIVELS